VADVAVEAADLGSTRRVYRLLRRRDIKTSLKHTEVYILWPSDGTWYMAEIEQASTGQLILDGSQQH
jgi:hypothetical protein